MNIPGFNADRSLYESPATYRVRESTINGSGVLTQTSKATQRWYARCQGRCAGGYIGGAATCFLSNDPQCMANNTSQYNSCNDTCDFLLSVME